MSTSEITIGADHPFPFPRMKGFLSPDKLDETIQQLTDNTVWNLTEKLDGCNVTISSTGWFASRNKIVADCRDTSLTGRVWNKVSLRNVPLVFEQTLKLREALKRSLELDWLQIALYGELVLPGTSQTPFDVYNYAARNIKQGSIYAFALGMRLPKNRQTPFFFDNAILMEHLSDEEYNYYIVPMSTYLSQLFSDLDILHIPPVAVDYLTYLLTNHHHIDILMHRKKEGFVLTSNDGQGFIKWKYNKAEEIKPELAEAAEKLVDSQELGDSKRLAAKSIMMVYRSGLLYVNRFSLVELCEFFNNHMAQHHERWKSTFERAANLGYYYLHLAMRNLEDELLRDLRLSYNRSRKLKSQIDPKVVLELKQEFAGFVKAKCWQYIQQTRKKIPDNECKCSILHEEAEESSEYSSETSNSDEYA